MPSTATDRLNGLTTSVAVKPPCVVAATSNITLSGTQTIGAVAVVSGDRVLVTAQTSSVDNGIWVASSGAWSRATDFDGSRDVVDGTLVLVGSTAATSQFWLAYGNATPIVPGTSAITFEQVDYQELTLRADLAASSGSSLVGFLQAGTGATARTMQSKAREWISVKDFGAVGDGVTDDTTKIQAAIDYAQLLLQVAAISGTNVTDFKMPAVLFPPGVYKTSAILNIINYGLHLVGDGAMIWNTTSSHFQVGNLVSPGPEYKTPVLFEGLVFNAASGTFTAFGSNTVTGVLVEANRVQFSRCTFWRMAIGIHCYGSIYTSIDNCEFRECDLGVQGDTNGALAANFNNIYRTSFFNNLGCVKFTGGAVKMVDVDAENNNPFSAAGVKTFNFISMSGSAGDPCVQLENVHTESNYCLNEVYFSTSAASVSKSIVIRSSGLLAATCTGQVVDLVSGTMLLEDSSLYLAAGGGVDMNIGTGATVVSINTTNYSTITGDKTNFIVIKNGSGSFPNGVIAEVPDGGGVFALSGNHANTVTINATPTVIVADDSHNYKWYVHDDTVSGVAEGFYEAGVGVNQQLNTIAATVAFTRTVSGLKAATTAGTATRVLSVIAIRI